MASTAPTNVYTIQELETLANEMRTYDLPEIIKIFDSVKYHGASNLSRLGSGLTIIFDARNERFLSPPTRDPGLNVAASKQHITLSGGRNYLRALFAQCAPSAVTYEGINACKGCQNVGNRRFLSCRQAFDANGVALAGGACGNCDSLSRGSSCSFHESNNTSASTVAAGSQAAGMGSFSASPPRDAASPATPSTAPQGAVQPGSSTPNSTAQAVQTALIPATGPAGSPTSNTPSEFDRLHRFAEYKMFDHIVKVESPMRILQVLMRGYYTVFAGAELRIGARIPGTDCFQVKPRDMEYFIFTAEGHELRAKTSPTANTLYWAAQLSGSFTPVADAHVYSILQTTKKVLCRNTRNEKATIQPRALFHSGQIRHLPKHAFLQFAFVNQDGTNHPTDTFFLLPGFTLEKLIEDGTFVHFDGFNAAVSDDVVDCTEGESLVGKTITTEQDLVGCGPRLEQVVVKRGQRMYVLVANESNQLIWTKDSHGRFFIH